ncbi:hypothetical protein [Actinomadura sp. 7K507]|uniref:hypothetical protein n=1 Tax=Actinomadura sp. 7K507 TaxID=2530365 RepID=UPI001047A7D6|nr:hypothetical protein [Actinomadura sp. 7K507]TDC89153.1 hypothetical protein E1285_17055 [Actinomadura sp. 7K507]
MNWAWMLTRIAVGAACSLTATGMFLAGTSSAQVRTAPVAPAEADLPDFDFSDCPALPEGFGELGSICYNQVVAGGRIEIGRLSHEITDPIRFTYAEVFNLQTGEWRLLAGPLHTKKVALPSEAIGLPPGRTVFATPEYAGGFTINYPNMTIGLKIRLSGAGLGGSCVIGSDEDPIPLSMTTGTTNPPPPNTPITGVPFTQAGTDGKVNIMSATHVDNAFPAPVAQGCEQFGENIDHLVNSTAGLPSPPGTNTVILDHYIALLAYRNLP